MKEDTKSFKTLINTNKINTTQHNKEKREKTQIK